MHNSIMLEHLIHKRKAKYDLPHQHRVSVPRYETNRQEDPRVANARAQRGSAPRMCQIFQL